MFSPKGYSLQCECVAGKWPNTRWAFVRHMVSDEVQQRIVEKLRMLPARQSIQKNPLFAFGSNSAGVTRSAKERAADCRRGTELRAIWDGMKPNYQGLLSGAMSPAAAAAAMQRDSMRNIEVMNREFCAVAIGGRNTGVGRPCCLALGLSGSGEISCGSCKTGGAIPIAYLFALPAVIVVFAVVVFPFFYNILISFSNMSLGHFSRLADGGIAKLHRTVHRSRACNRSFWYIFAKTIVWTAVNIAFSRWAWTAARCPRSTARSVGRRSTAFC